MEIDLVFNIAGPAAWEAMLKVQKITAPEIISKNSDSFRSDYMLLLQLKEELESALKNVRGLKLATSLGRNGKTVSENLLQDFITFGDFYSEVITVAMPYIISNGKFPSYDVMQKEDALRLEQLLNRAGPIEEKMHKDLKEFGRYLETLGIKMF